MRRHLRGLERDASRKFGPGVPGGTAGGQSRPQPPERLSPSRRGWSGWRGSGASKGQPRAPKPPRPPSRRGSNLLQRAKRPPPEGTATGGRRPGGQRPRLVRANFGRLVGTSGAGGGAGGASPPASAAACVSGLTFVRARAALAAEPPTRVFQSKCEANKGRRHSLS